jgi:4-diphosphocytidyl-2C-methyl-D-erythritol kinase
MTDTIQLESPAKVNLRLEILKIREDGYHELRTIFQKISLSDVLRFSLKKEKGISIKTTNPHLPVGNRLPWGRPHRNWKKNSTGIRNGRREQ